MPKLGTFLLNCKPSVLEVLVIISHCFDKILNVGTLIPKIESILFPELQKKEFLFSVSRYEESVNEMLLTLIFFFELIIKRLYGYIFLYKIGNIKKHKYQFQEIFDFFSLLKDKMIKNTRELFRII